MIYIWRKHEKKTITILPIFIAIAIVGYLFKEELRLVENKSVEYQYNKKYNLMSFYDFYNNKKECQCFEPIIEFALKNNINIPVEVLKTDNFIIKNPEIVNKLMSQNLLEYTTLPTPTNEEFILKMISLYSVNTPIGNYYRLWNEMISQKYSNNKELFKFKVQEYNITMAELMIIKYSGIGGNPIRISSFLENYKIELNEQIATQIIINSDYEISSIKLTEYLFNQLSKKFKNPSEDIYRTVLRYGSEELISEFFKNNKASNKKIRKVLFTLIQRDAQKNLIRNLKILTKNGYNLAPIKKDIMLYAIENNMLNVLFYAYEFIDKKQNDNMEIVKLMKMTKEVY